MHVPVGYGSENGAGAASGCDCILPANGLPLSHRNLDEYEREKQQAEETVHHCGAVQRREPRTDAGHDPRIGCLRTDRHDPGRRVETPHLAELFSGRW